MGEQSGDLALTIAQWDKVKRQFQLPEKHPEATPDIARIEMISISGGSFRMGDVPNYGKRNDEKPVHEVTISETDGV